MRGCFDTFNAHFGTNYQFTEVNPHLSYADLTDLGELKLIIDQARLFAYHTKKMEGTIFEVVYKFTGGHFSTAIVGRTLNGVFEPFDLNTFPDNVTIIPDNILDKLNSDISNAIRVQ